MMSRRYAMTLCGAASVALVAGCSDRNEKEAAREASVVVYSSTDEPFFNGVISAFEATNPQIRVQYHALPSAEVHRRYLDETARGLPTADLLINSAMDLQIKLANDGRARPYRPIDNSVLPSWSSWNYRAYALSVEPIVIGFNRTLIPDGPKVLSRLGLANFIQENADLVSGRVGLYDPEKSSLGMLLINQDLRIDHESWDLIATLGRHHPRLYVSAKDMIDDVATGRLVLAYNIIGSYALERARKDSVFGVIIPEDYTLMVSRVAILPREGRHPNAATELMDFLLSKEGQQQLAKRGLLPVRADVIQPYEELALSNMRAVKVGPALLANLDAMNRGRFLDRWRGTIGKR